MAACFILFLYEVGDEACELCFHLAKRFQSLLIGTIFDQCELRVFSKYVWHYALPLTPSIKLSPLIASACC